MTYNNFNDVEDINLRTWNRCATTFNIMGEHGRDAATKYTEQFSNSDKESIREMFASIREVGYEAVRASISREHQAYAG